MQQVRGFVYFPDRIWEELGDIELPGVQILYLDALRRAGKDIECPGVFISGAIDESYGSEDVVRQVQRMAGVEEQMKHCDISLEREDHMHHVKQGALSGYYIGIRVRPPYEHAQLQKAAESLGEELEATDILVRGCEQDGDAPMACIDLVTQDPVQEPQQLLGLHMGPVVTFSLRR